MSLKTGQNISVLECEVKTEDNNCLVDCHPQTFLQFALFNFRRSLEVYEKLKRKQGTTRSHVKISETIRSKCSRRKKQFDWTWKELVDTVKYTDTPIEGSLLPLLTTEHNKLAIDCFKCIMKYMGDLPLSENQTEIDSIYSILAICYKCPELRDEAYCQLIKQTTNNRSTKTDSCLKGWRLLVLMSAYFAPSDSLKPYFLFHLETIASDDRRNFCENARMCLKNLNKTFQLGGRRNVPSLEELNALSKDKFIKQQAYYIAGGTKLIVDTWTVTIVDDIIREICTFLTIRDDVEVEEYSLYCIVEGDPYTIPLTSDEYILDLTTELNRNGYTFYLLFSRAVWYHPLRLDNHLYIEITYNQMAPDYIDGLFLLSSGSNLAHQVEDAISRIGALLHKASCLSDSPQNQDVLYLLPKTIPYLSTCTFEKWAERIRKYWEETKALTPLEAKAQCLDLLQKWPLFGSSFFTVLLIDESESLLENVLALNRNGIFLLDIDSHLAMWRSTFISTYFENEQNVIQLSNKDNETIRLQSDYVVEIMNLIEQYTKQENYSYQLTTS